MPDGTQIDHIGLACRDLQEGIQYFQDLTGVKPHLNDPSTSLPFQNAYVRIGEETFLEILGPNPTHTGFHPLKSLLKNFKEPTLWFWYISTIDFDGLEASIKEAGRCIDRKIEMETEAGATYVSGSIGPGFYPVYPNVIQWKSKPEKDIPMEMQVTPMKGFSVTTSEKEKMKSFFLAVGISDRVLKDSAEDGKSYLSLTLDTPKGEVQLKSEAKPLSTWNVLTTLAKDLFGFL